MTHPDTDAGPGSGAGPAPDENPTSRFVTLTSPATANATTPVDARRDRRPAATVHDPVSVDERGSLAIENIVAEKVAVAAAGEIDGVGGAARRVLGVPTGRDSTENTDRRPQVSARVTGQTAALEVRLTVAYPASVRSVTEAARAHIRDQVTALTGLRVTRVDITVAALTRHPAPTRRVIT